MRFPGIPAMLWKALCCAPSLVAQTASVQTMVSSVVSCVSADSPRQHCTADTSAGVVMLRQTSEANCLLGRNWGYDGQGVWVTEGCGGEFGTGSTSRKSEPPQAANTLVPTSEKSEMAKVTTGVNPDVKYTGYFTPYGTLRTIVSIPETGAQIQDNASRMGIDFKTMGPVKVFGTGEWGLNLVQSETSLNPGATTNNNFGVINPTTQPVVGIRLGFFGVDTGKFGRLSFGKQNATHYDIVSYTTDRFNVFGGQSTAAYVAGTDGGESGTGRADQTILYHVKFAKIFDLGAQGQLRTADTSQAFNGFGFSLQAKLTPAVQVGGSFTKTFFSTEKTNLFFNGRGTDYWSLAAKGNWRTLEWGAVWIRQANGDLAFVRNPVVGEPSPIAVGFSASGVELYSKLWLHKTALVGGFEGYFPRDLSLLIRPEFKTRYAILGAEYHFSPSGYTYVEARVGDTKDAEGRGGYNAAAIGFRYDFSWKTPHIQWPAPY